MMPHTKLLKKILFWLYGVLLLPVFAVGIFWVPWGVPKSVGWALLLLTTPLGMLSFVIFPLIEWFPNRRRKQVRVWRVLYEGVSAFTIILVPFFLYRDFLGFSRELISILIPLVFASLLIQFTIMLLKAELEKLWLEQMQNS